MKKLAMLTVKGAVGLVPKAVRNKLKSNHRLTEFYSRSLQRSGLFYGFPSEKKRMALYSAYLKQQAQYFQEMASVDKNGNEIYVLIFGAKSLSLTLDSLNRLGVNHERICVVAENSGDESIRCASTISEAVDNLSESTRLLLLNSGDAISKVSFDVFLTCDSGADVVYCDTDKIDAKDRRVSPHFLPDWNPDLQLSTGYISTGVMCNAALVKRSGVRSSTIAGIVSELWIKLPHSSVEHIPYTLIHRSPNKKITLEALADIRTVVESFTSATPSYNEELAVNNIQWPVESEPLVSLIIPTKNGKALVKACIESILEKTVYQNYEILLIDNGSDEKESLDYFAKLEKHSKIRVLSYPGEFNYSAINNFGVQHASKTSSIIGLINNDIEVINPYWLTSMVGHAVRDDIGCVGAKLLYSDGRIQHAGVVLGYGGGAGHAHKYFPRYHPGYIKRLIATQNYSAVTAACLLVKKSLFVDVNGLNEQDLTVAFNDVDFCLRVRETGVRNVYCAEAELYHHESVSRGLDHAPEKAARFNRELEFLKQQWGKYIQHDPAYSPNLTLMRENFSIKSKEEFSG